MENFPFIQRARLEPFSQRKFRRGYFDLGREKSSVVGMPTKLVNKHSGAPFTHYIGRPSIFGNPYVIGKHGTRDEVIDRHRGEFLQRIIMDDEFRREVLKLKNGALSCFCAPDNRCHGETYIEYLDFAPKFRVAGIGSREISHNEEQLLFRLGEYIAKRNWTLSSGNANGSDEWFARGVNSISPKRVMLYLPWESYNKERIHPENRWSAEHKDEWIPVAEKCHPNWQQLKSSVRSMMIRNVGIVSRANVVLALPSRKTGGTRHGMAAAREFSAPVVGLLEGEQSFEQICDFFR